MVLPRVHIGERHLVDRAEGHAVRSRMRGGDRRTSGEIPAGPAAARRWCASRLWSASRTAGRSSVSTALSTSPMPPAPNADTISSGRRRIPGVSATVRGDDYTFAASACGRRPTPVGRFWRRTAPRAHMKRSPYDPVTTPLIEPVTGLRGTSRHVTSLGAPFRGRRTDGRCERVSASFALPKLHAGFSARLTATFSTGSPST
jgi:hypothetical protein